MFRLAFLVYLFRLIQCEEYISGLMSDQMMGVNTIHDPKPMDINKDTIITRNLKLENRNKMGKTAESTKKQDSGPSYSPVPESIKAHVDQFKKNMSECLKEVQGETVRRLSPKPDSPVHGECLIACVLKRNGVIENRKVNKDNLINLVSKFFGKDTKLMKKLEKNLDQCVEMSVHHRDECDLAARLNACTNDLMAANKHQIYVNY